jgi:hypothetical protein
MGEEGWVGGREKIAKHHASHGTRNESNASMVGCARARVCLHVTLGGCARSQAEEPDMGGGVAS